MTMWQAIDDNTRRSRWVIVLMALLLLTVGGLLGRVLLGPGGAAWGVGGALALWGALVAITFLGGERAVLFAAGAREADRTEAPRLWNVVEEMTIAAGLEAMPRVWVVDSYMQNAFAVGRRPETAGVVVTEGLIRRLTRDELQGVIAHEIAHIRNQDVRFMTVASVMLGSIALLADTCRRALWFGGGRRSRMTGGPQVYLILMGLLAVAAFLAPVSARLLYLVCSRKREFLADASAARFTRYPEGLASALEKIAQGRGVTRGDSLRVLAPMYIVNPLDSASVSRSLFATHPPTSERVRILRAMVGAGWGDYERAYQDVLGRGRHCLDPGLVSGDGYVPCREPEADSAGEAIESEVASLLDRAVAMSLIPCECGLRIKVPALFPRNRIDCPRCAKGHRVPQPGPSPTAMTRSGRTYARAKGGWDEFRCSCGRVNQLSPGLRVSSIQCRGCGRTIQIRARSA